MRLKDKVAIITGSGQGIGRAIALTFAQEGASVVIPDLNPETAESTAKEAVALGTRALALRVDCCEPTEVDQMVETTLKEFSHIDILVNNIHASAGGPFLQLTPEQWDYSIRGVVKGYFLCSQRVAKEMARQGSGGKIISIGSVAAEIALGVGGVPYATGKAAIQGLTRSMALELAAHKINVNVINPGFIDTPLAYRILTEHQRQARMNAIPLGRYGQATDIANMALFLASSESDWITGQAFTVDGGFRATFMIPKPKEGG